MPLKVFRKEKETVQNLIRRFIKIVRDSGILLEAKKRQFYQRPKSKTAKKEAALRREALKKEYEKAQKFGGGR